MSHVENYCRAATTNDVDGLMSTLAPGAELVSPLAGGTVFREPEDLRILFNAIYSSLTEMVWEEHYQDGNVHTVCGRARVLGRPLYDAMIIETDEEGRVRRIRPHLRPWSALTAFALAMGPHLARHPGTLRRAMRN